MNQEINLIHKHPWLPYLFRFDFMDNPNHECFFAKKVVMKAFKVDGRSLAKPCEVKDELKLIARDILLKGGSSKDVTNEYRRLGWLPKVGGASSRDKVRGISRSTLSGYNQRVIKQIESGKLKLL